MGGGYHGPGGSAAGKERGPRTGKSAGSDEELQELGRISGELMHDLGGILGVLSGRVALACEEASLGRIPSDELSRIQKDTDELRRMVIEILEELRNRPRSLEVTFPVTDTIDEVVNRWLVGAPSVTTTLRSTLSPRAEITGPRSFFTRSFGNLLRNAARHARSEIRITIRPDVERSAVQVKVEDDGEGVADAVREKVFEAFVSASGSGSGLGLSFARWGIEKLGGTLELLDEPTDLGGAAFLLTVPLSTLPRARAKAPLSSHAAPRVGGRSPREALSGVRIAIVDDDRAVRNTLTRLLNRSGADAVEVDPSSWSSEARSVSALQSLNSDVILLDVNLDRTSGPEVLRALHQAAPELVRRVLFITGGTPPSELDDYPVISKMVGWDELVARILQIACPTGED